MPSVVTHYSFAKKHGLDKDERHLGAFFVGAQGPDHFFAYGQGLHKKRPNKIDVRSLGSITQHDELAPNYVGMIEYAKKSPDKDLLFAYIDGLLTHYSLDRACHPYIFYFTGFTDRPEDSKEVQQYYNHGHLLMEIFLDVIIGQKEGNKGNPSKFIKIDNDDLMKISMMWYEVNKDYQKVINIEPDSFYKAVKDYQQALSFTYSPLGIKKWFLKLIFGKRSTVYGLSAPRNLKKFKDCDFLNESHSDWYMPDNTGPLNKSFLDLFNVDAKEIYSKLHSCLNKAKNDEEYMEEFASIGQHINHEGIIPNSPKLTWKLIWPKGFLDDIIEPNIKH